MKIPTIPHWLFVLTCIALVAMVALAVFGLVNLFIDPTGTVRAFTEAGVR